VSESGYNSIFARGPRRLACIGSSEMCGHLLPVTYLI